MSLWFVKLPSFSKPLQQFAKTSDTQVHGWVCWSSDTRVYWVEVEIVFNSIRRQTKFLSRRCYPISTEETQAWTVPSGSAHRSLIQNTQHPNWPSEPPVTDIQDTQGMSQLLRWQELHQRRRYHVLTIGTLWNQRQGYSPKNSGQWWLGRQFNASQSHMEWISVIGMSAHQWLKSNEQRSGPPNVFNDTYDQMLEWSPPDPGLHQGSYSEEGLNNSVADLDQSDDEESLASRNAIIDDEAKGVDLESQIPSCDEDGRRSPDAQSSHSSDIQVIAQYTENERNLLSDIEQYVDFGSDGSDEEPKREKRPPKSVIRRATANRDLIIIHLTHCSK